MKLKKIIKFVKSKIRPTYHEKMVKKYQKDGGDSFFRYNYKLNNSSNVLDLGGYKGQFVSDIFSRYQCNVFVFEPMFEFAKQIEKRFQLNNKIEVFQFGLGDSTRSEKLGISDNGSSIFAKGKNFEEIRILDIKEWMKQKEIEKVSLIKLNIEGGEYEVLSRLIETGLINLFENIQVQFHDISINSRSQMEEIQNNLKKTHNLTYQYDFVWENWSKIKP